MTALVNDVVYWEDIVVENAQGVVEPIPAGTVFTGSSDNAAGNCIVGTHPVTGNPARAVNALFASGSFNATVSSPGLTSWVENFVIGPDNTPTQVAGASTSISTVPQPVPPPNPAGP